MNFILKLSIVVALVFCFPFYAHSGISFDANGKWETTFDYPQECSQRGYGDEPNCGISPDGIQWGWGAGVSSWGTYTQATADANYPGGGGGLGARFWNYDGHNALSGPIRVVFPSPQKEFWVRWYMRYQEGFRWKSYGQEHYIHYNKTLYTRTAEGSGAGFVPSLMNTFHLTSANHRILFNAGGWDDIYGRDVSDGSWHCFEAYYKMNSTVGSNDGIFRWWVNGVLKAERTDLNHDGGNANAHNGNVYFDFNNNQNEVANADGPIGLPYAYIDYDDMVIYNQTPPNIDAHGNPFIGPLPPAPPWGLSIDVQ